MKVVLFCGGLGMRMKGHTATPKPLVRIGHRPILWNVMKYYAHHGHKDFILCLGHMAERLKRYFLDYNECLSNDFVLSQGGRSLELQSSDIGDWRITFADTGIHSNIGQRLRAVQPYLQGEDVFLANYSDGLTNLPLDPYLEYFRGQDKIAMFLNVRPNLSYHVVTAGADGVVERIQDIAHSHIRINGGYFVFRKEIFRYLRDGEELVQEPFQRLVAEQQLVAYSYDGFWVSMDTFKDKQRLEELCARGGAPWEVWKQPLSNARQEA